MGLEELECSAEATASDVDRCYRWCEQTFDEARVISRCHGSMQSYETEDLKIGYQRGVSHLEQSLQSCWCRVRVSVTGESRSQHTNIEHSHTLSIEIKTLPILWRDVPRVAQMLQLSVSELLARGKRKSSTRTTNV